VRRHDHHARLGLRRRAGLPKVGPRRRGVALRLADAIQTRAESCRTATSSRGELAPGKGLEQRKQQMKNWKTIGELFKQLEKQLNNCE
jgi:hypothetical protein